MWWGGSTVEDYENRVGLFNSEYGMQSLLPMSSLKQFLTKEDLKEDNTEAMQYHNKMRGGAELVEKYTR